jgi:transposase
LAATAFRTGLASTQAEPESRTFSPNGTAKRSDTALDDRSFDRDWFFCAIRAQRFDTVGVPPLIEGVQFDGLIADKAFDSNSIIEELNERGAKIVISQHPRRAKPLAIDAEIYKWRHLIENFFAKLKEFKRIAMRADKTDKSFVAMIYLTAAVINSR